MNLIFVLLFSLFFGYDQLPDTQQIVVVTTADWETTSGSMTAYERSGDKWVAVLRNIPIVTGRTGLAWGKGLHDEKLHEGKLKREGDGKSPAGIFRLSGLFGYQAIQAGMNAITVDAKTFCVDDIKSKYYNRIVHGDTVQKDWDSAETMLMKSGVYKYGIFVDYNTDQPVAGDGSCIFMHIWGQSKGPTAGCTAMTETDILRLIEFLDKKKNPLLVQVPRGEYIMLKQIYNLP